MKLTRVMQVSKSELHDFLLKSLMYDIEQSTKKKVAVDKLRVGYNYNKELSTKMGKPSKVKVTIEALDDSNYKASFKSAQGVNTLSYQYREGKDAEHEVEVTYEEEYITESAANTLNFRLMSFLFNRSNKKRMVMTLRQIEESIKRNQAS